MESPSSSQPASAQKGAVSGNVAAIPYTFPGVTGGEAVLTSFADITETVAAQRVLATEHDRLQTISDYQPDPHVFAKAIRDEAGLVVDFRVTHANDAAAAGKPLSKRDRYIRASPESEFSSKMAHSPVIGRKTDSAITSARSGSLLQDEITPVAQATERSEGLPSPHNRTG